MKQIAKSLVSLVIALSVLATMCVIGISASAAPKAFIMVSEDGAKNVADMAVGQTTNATGKFEVVNTADLTGGTAGVPAAKAYKATASKGIGKDGFIAKVNGPTTDFSELYNVRKTSTIDMWVYVSDASAVNLLVLRLFTEGQMQNVNGEFYTAYVFQIPGISVSTGWNHVKVAASSFGDFASKKIIGYALHEHNGAKAEYTFALASLKITFDDGLPADGKTYLVGGTQNEAGVVAGTWSAETYEGGTGAYTADGAVKLKKDLPYTVDLVGKTVTAWLHVSNSAAGFNGQVEICTVSQDTGEFGFNTSSLGLKDGWNKVVLDVNNKAGSSALAKGVFGYDGTTDASNSNPPDASNINHVRVHNTGAAVKVGAIYVTPDDGLPKDGKTYLVGGTQNEAGIDVGTWSAETYDGGAGAYTADGVVKFQKNLTAPVDLSGKLVTAWIHVSNISAGLSGQLEISTKDADTGEFAFRIADMGLKDGWNKVILDINNGAGTVDLLPGVVGCHEQNDISGANPPTASNINYVRLHNGAGAAVKVGAMYVTPDNEIPTVVDESEVAVFAPVDKLAGDFLPTKDNGAVTTVVDISTLTGGKYEGVNTTAYKVEFTDGALRKEGVYTSLKTPVRMKSAGAESDYTFEAWIWAEKEVDNYIFQFYADDLEKDTAVSSNHTEKWVYRISNDNANTEETITLKAGWNHVKVTLDSTFTKLGSGGNEYCKAAYASYAKNQIITGFSIHDNADGQANACGVSIAIADAMLYKTSQLQAPEVDGNTVGTTILSANKTKNLESVNFYGGATGSLEKTSSLKGGESGVPSAEAYKVNLSAAKAGIAIPVENPDWSAAAESKIDDDHGLKNYGVNMWIWVSDVSKMNLFVVRFYDSYFTGDINAWVYQWNGAFQKSGNFQNGWNNITLWFPTNNKDDYDHHTNRGVDGKTVTSFTLHDHNTGGYEIAIACARLVSTADDISGGWLSGSATGDAVSVAAIVIAVLLAAMAASVTVYFGKKSR